MLPWVTLSQDKVTLPQGSPRNLPRVKRVGRYALMKRFGKGGMAEVWIGKLSGGRDFEKIVAAKLLPQDSAAHPDLQRSLGDEAHLLMSLRHPNVVEVLDFNFEGESPYLVMEFIEGAELRSVLKHLQEIKQTMPVEIACFIVGEIANGLLHAHERCDRKSGKPLRIVHRDVSPSNILVSRQGEAKLSDFGIAKSALQTEKTQLGQIKGKFRYMAPEQARGDEIDQRCDIFSLGLVFYECLFGGPAYDDPSDTRLYDKAREGKIELPDNLDSDLERMLKRLLAIDPRARYGSLKTFMEDLSAFMGRKGPICDRDTLSSYLAELNLREFVRATALREETERWRPESHPTVEGTPSIVTLNYRAKEPKKGRGLIFMFSGLAAVFLIGMTIGLPKVRTFEHPLADQRRTDNLPTTTSAAKPERPAIVAPAVATQPAPKKKLSKVIFDADPFAEVSVSGLFRGLETPLQKTAPEGSYLVSFSHPPTGKKTNARLKIDDSGRTYVCRALMEVESDDKEASAKCWVQ